MVRKYKQFKELSEADKDKILDFITRSGIPISEARKKLNLSVATINKIYATRYMSQRDKQKLKQKNHE